MANLVMDGVTLARKSGSDVTIQDSNVKVIASSGYGDATNPNPTAWGFNVTTSSATGGQGILLQGQASGSITFDAEL